LLSPLDRVADVDTFDLAIVVRSSDVLERPLYQKVEANGTLDLSIVGTLKMHEH